MKCYKTVTIVFRIHRRCQGTESGSSTMPPFFRYLNPPMISEVHKNNMCVKFLHNLLLSSFAKLIQTVMFNRFTMIAQKLTLRISPHKLPCPGTAPVAAISLKFFRENAQICFRKVRKFQDPSSNRFGRYLRKIRGVDKSPPPPCH